MILRKNISLFLALLFHVSGLIGMLLTPYKEWFIDHTLLNLMLMAVLLVWNQPEKNTAFLIFILVAFMTGMLTEMVGINSSMLFGRYAYGNRLGPKINGVPLVIGINWFVIVFCSGTIMGQLHRWLNSRYEQLGLQVPQRIEILSMLLDGALLAVFFDWVMEPVAMKLDLWQWANGIVPLYNYVCWFVISILLLGLFRYLKFGKANLFAVHLFIIQLLFFTILRMYL